MKSPRQSSHQQNGSISSNTQNDNQSGEAKLLQYNVSNYIQLLMQQKNIKQQQSSSSLSQQPIQANMQQAIASPQCINPTSYPVMIQLEKQQSQNQLQNLQLVGVCTSQQLQQYQQQQQQQQFQGNSSNMKNLESNDINYLLKAYQEREKQVKLLRSLRKEYRIYDDFKTKEFQTFYLNGYDSNSQCMREEKQRVMQEECTIKKYFNIKADQLNLKIVVFNLINSILQTNQVSYNELLHLGQEYEANELLKQTNKFKEEIHKFIYKNQFRLTSIIIYICNFSRQRLMVEQERFDIIIKRHEDVYKDTIKQKQAAQQASMKQQQQQTKIQQLSKNLSQAIQNYKQINGLIDNQGINQIYSNVMGNQTNGTKARLQSAQPHSNYNYMMNSNNYLNYQEFSSDGNLEEVDDDYIDEQTSNILNLNNINDVEVDSFQMQDTSPNKLKRSYSIEPSGISDQNSGGVIKVKSPSKNLRIKQQISSAKKPQEIRSNRGSAVGINGVYIVNGQEMQQISSAKRQNTSSLLFVPAPKSLLGLQQSQTQSSSQFYNQKQKIGQSNNATPNYLSTTTSRAYLINNQLSNSNLITNQSSQYNQYSNGNTVNQLNVRSSDFVSSGNLSSNINLGYPSLGPAATLSIKLSIVKNEKSRKILKKIVNDYNVSDIPSRVTCRRFNKSKKCMQQNHLSQNDVEETFYHLTMHADLLYSTTEIQDTKVSIERLFQQMIKQNNQIKNTLQSYCNQTKNYQSKVTKTFKQKVIDYHKHKYQHKQSSHSNKQQTPSNPTTFSVIYFQQLLCNYLIIDPSALSNIQLSNISNVTNYFTKQSTTFQTNFKPSNLLDHIKSKWVNQKFIQFGPKDLKYINQIPTPQGQITVSENTSSQNIDNNPRRIIHSNSTECLPVKGLLTTPSQRTLIIRSSNLNNHPTALQKENSSPTQINRRYQQDERQIQSSAYPSNVPGRMVKESSSINNFYQNQQQQTNQTPRQNIETPKNTTNTYYTNTLQDIQETLSSIIFSKQSSETVPIQNKISNTLSSPPLLPSMTQKTKKMKSLKENQKTPSAYQASEKSVIPQKSKLSSKSSKKSQSQQNQMRNSLTTNQIGVNSQMQQSNLLSKRNSGKFPINTLLQLNNQTQPQINIGKQNNQFRQSLSNKQSLDNSFDNQPSPSPRFNNLIQNSQNPTNFKIKHINLNVQQNSIQDIIKQNIVSQRLTKSKQSILKTYENQDFSQQNTEKSVTINEGDILNTITSYKTKNTFYKDDLSFETNPQESIGNPVSQITNAPKSSKKSKMRPQSNLERKQTKKGKNKNKSKLQQCYLDSDSTLQQQQQPQQDSIFFKENLIKNLKIN